MSSMQSKQGQHAVLPNTTHDEAARQGFVRGMRKIITSQLTPGHKAVFGARIEPKLENELGRKPQTRQEIREAMRADPYHQMWSTLLRTTQEMMWDTIGETVERQAKDLNKTFLETKENGSKSTLTLNPEIELPRYSKGVDYHTMPGGYHSESGPDDVSVGAMYDQSIHLYMMGGMGSYNDDVGEMLSTFVKWKYPDLKPAKILDIGCSVGHSTLPYAEKFPDAEIHAIDVSAPLLRYGYTRTESLGKAIHFSQQNAEHTNFDDGSFDLIVSHIMIHETSLSAVKNIMKEGNRLLAPGGLMVHLEMLPFSKKSPLEQYLTDWDSTNNHEPFIGKMNELDMFEILTGAGFDESEAFVEFVPIGFNEDKSKTPDYAHLIGGERHIFGAHKKSAP